MVTEAMAGMKGVECRCVQVCNPVKVPQPHPLQPNTVASTFVESGYCNTNGRV